MKPDDGVIPGQNRLRDEGHGRADGRGVEDHTDDGERRK